MEILKEMSDQIASYDEVIRDKKKQIKNLTFDVESLTNKRESAVFKLQDKIDLMHKQEMLKKN